MRRLPDEFGCAFAGEIEVNGAGAGPGRGRSAQPLEVESLEEVTEGVGRLLLRRRSLGALLTFNVTLGGQRGLLHYLLCNENRHARADGEGNRITGA